MIWIGMYLVYGFVIALFTQEWLLWVTWGWYPLLLWWRVLGMTWRTRRWFRRYRR